VPYAVISRNGGGYGVFVDGLYIDRWSSFAEESQGVSSEQAEITARAEYETALKSALGKITGILT
jgi:hypothetical protein